MKKKFLLIGLSILLAVILTASSPSLIPVEFVHGRGDWHANICNVPDHISTPPTQRTRDIFLIGGASPSHIGEGFPSHGEWTGCHIDAWGTLFTSGSCRYMRVVDFDVACPTALNR